MPLYDLPIWAVDTYKFPADGIRGVGWKLTAVEVPYAVHGSKAWESHFHSIRERYPGYSVNNISFADTIRIAPQIIAETNTRLSAQTTLELLLTSLSILDGNLALDLEDGLAVPRDRSHLEDLTSDDVLVASSKNDVERQYRHRRRNCRRAVAPAIPKILCFQVEIELRNCVGSLDGVPPKVFSEGIRRYAKLIKPRSHGFGNHTRLFRNRRIANGA